MKSLRRTTSKLSKWLLLALFLVVAPAALASNTWYVDGVSGDDNNNCMSPQTACKTIGHAISLSSSGDSIMVAPAIYTENLTISFALQVIGADRATTIVDGGQAATVFTIFPRGSYQVSLENLTIRNGIGGGNSSGGVTTYATLVINNTTISGNTQGGINCAVGLRPGCSLTINNSTISGNSGVSGGIWVSRGSLTINNSTISGNDGGYAGGIFFSGGRLRINNSTISGHDGYGIVSEVRPHGTATINSSTISRNARGIVIVYSTPPTLQNTIVANNSVENCSYGTITSNGYNLSSDDTCNFQGPGDMNNTDPKLGKLGYHGGPTRTIPLLTASPAIDAGNPNGCTDGKGRLLKKDQRGKPRPDKQSGICDIGAYERQKH